MSEWQNLNLSGKKTHAFDHWTLLLALNVFGITILRTQEMTVGQMIWNAMCYGLNVYPSTIHMLKP